MGAGSRRSGVTDGVVDLNGCSGNVSDSAFPVGPWVESIHAHPPCAGADVYRSGIRITLSRDPTVLTEISCYCNNYDI